MLNLASEGSLSSSRQIVQIFISLRER